MDLERRKRITASRRVRREVYRQALNWLKSVRGCADCQTHDPTVLTFDHVRGGKVLTIGEARADASLARLWMETRKCDVVCFNCHHRREALRRPRKPPVVVPPFHNRRHLPT